MSTKPISVSTVKKGSTVVIDGEACKVTDIQVSRPGKHGHAKVRMTGVGLIDEKKRVVVMPGHDHIDSPIIDKRNAQVLSVSGDTANVMDMETYETFDLKIPSELKGKCTDGANVSYWIILENKVMKDIN
jgi:translation initiation factor 5A